MVSTAWSNATATQWLNITSSFNLGGVVTDNNGVEQVDMAWRSFAVSANMSSGGIEINKIGSAYMNGVAKYILGLTNTKLFVFTYRLNGRGIAQSRIPGAIGTVTVLNFSSLAVPLSQWTYGYDASTNSVTWTLSKLPTFGLQVSETVNEALPSKILYELSFSLNPVVITAPLRSSVAGDTLKAIFGDSATILMSGIIASVSAIALGTTFYEKRILSRITGRKSKR
ncbi:MAG TPA: hypothetical protein VFE96_00185 [Candidatus Bathyarchaeia archaeon]|nr:hypothetical protein [Candidatus Bathyarchaeia archaeon]